MGTDSGVNPPPKPGSDEMMNRQSACSVGLSLMQTAFRSELLDRERKLWAFCLMRFTAQVIADITHRAIITWRPEFGINFPPIATLVEYGESIARENARVSQGQGILGLPEPSQLIDKAYKSGISDAEIVEWLESGKRSQRENIAGLTDGAKAIAATITAEQVAAERNGKTQVPADLVSRRSWAHSKARAQGWIPAGREPGEEG